MPTPPPATPDPALTPAPRATVTYYNPNVTPGLIDPDQAACVRAVVGGVALLAAGVALIIRGEHTVGVALVVAGAGELGVKVATLL